MKISESVGKKIQQLVNVDAMQCNLVLYQAEEQQKQCLL